MVYKSVLLFYVFILLIRNIRFILLAIGALFTSLLIYLHVTFDDKKGCIADYLSTEYSMEYDDFNVTDMLVITLPGISNRAYQFYFNNKLGAMNEYDLMEFNFTEYHAVLPDLCAKSSFDKIIVNVYNYYKNYIYIYIHHIDIQI